MRLPGLGTLVRAQAEIQGLKRDLWQEGSSGLHAVPPMAGVLAGGPVGAPGVSELVVEALGPAGSHKVVAVGGHCSRGGASAEAAHASHGAAWGRGDLQGERILAFSLSSVQRLQGRQPSEDSPKLTSPLVRWPGVLEDTSEAGPAYCCGHGEAGRAKNDGHLLMNLPVSMATGRGMAQFSQWDSWAGIYLLQIYIFNCFSVLGTTCQQICQGRTPGPR